MKKIYAQAAVVVTAVLWVIVICLAKVVPVYEGYLKDAGEKIHIVGQLLITMSLYVRLYWFIPVLPVLVILTIIVVVWRLKYR